MAISPASDIILDVARAADPQKAMAATRALAEAQNVGTVDFDGALKGLSGVGLRNLSYRNPTAVLPMAATREGKAAAGLESLLLKGLIDQMLPKDAADVFGSGVAGDVWRSMLSEKIADQIAKSGALKIGTRLFAAHPDLLRAGKHATGRDE
jgi:hypothetical protein